MADGAKASSAAHPAAEAAKRRSEEIEAEQIAQVHAIWDRLPDTKKRIFEYIQREIAAGHRIAAGRSVFA